MWPAVVAHQAELLGGVGKVGAVAAAKPSCTPTVSPLLAASHEVVVVAREAELVLGADVHVDALGGDVGGARGAASRG